MHHALAVLTICILQISLVFSLISHPTVATKLTSSLQSSTRKGTAINMHGDVSSTESIQSLSKYDLWISGAGTLGSMIAERYRAIHPAASIVAETATNNRHNRLSSLGIKCKLRESRNNEDSKSAKNVIISIPPSVALDYAKEVSDACELWAGPENGGKLIFTSSVGVYGDPDGVTVDESSPVANNPRSQR